MPFDDNTMPRGCRLLDFPESADARGSLSFAEGMQHIPFQIERVFWIYGVPEGRTRGEHSHNESSEVVVPVSGAFDMFVSDGNRETVVRMDSPKRGILIPPGIWCELRNFQPGTVCVVFASHPYNAAGYTNDFAQYRNELVRAVRYDSSHRDEWNSFVASSKNGTFLLNRNYMDYHSDRYEDCSLMFYKNGRLTALLPANHVASEGTVQSHGGLTYGGLVLSREITAVEALETFSCAMDWMKTELRANRLVYKPIPYIYSTAPAEEDLYALFRSGGKLVSRAVSSVVDNANRLPMRKLRKRGVAKALKAGLTVSRTDEESDWEVFWQILSDVLKERHNRLPVHSLREIRLLKEKFSDRISLYVVRNAEEIVAGTLIYDTGHVAHAQYIAASAAGKSNGALDMLFDELIGRTFAERPYFDFGVSTEQGGAYLNEGLIFQKEGFGARSVVYDTYEINLI